MVCGQLILGRRPTMRNLKLTKMTEYLSLDEVIREVDELIKEGCFDEAKTELENLLFDEPGFGKAHAYLGWLYLNPLSDSKRASTHFEFAIKFDPAFPGAYINYSLLLIEQRNAERLIDLLLKARLVEECDAVFVEEHLGKAYELKGEFKKAIAAYKSALKLTVESWQGEELQAHINRVRKKRWTAFWSW